MKTTRISAGIAATLALGLGLAACSSGDSGDSGGSGDSADQTLRVWLIQPDKNAQGPANDYLKTTFEEQNPGWTLKIEEQQWGEYKGKYTTSLASNDAPDLVEMGNTDAPSFTSSGALMDLTDQYDTLGGDDLLQSFVEIGSFDGKFFAPPYYSGARVVFYSSDTVTTPVPTTLEQYVADGEAMTTDTFSGIYFPGKDWYNVLPYVWANDGFIAEEKDGTWEAGFSSEGGIKGLTMAQQAMTKANSQTVAPADGDESKGYNIFCEGKVGFLAGPTWVGGSIEAPADGDAPGCPDTYGANLQAFVLPGMTEGSVAPTFAGGSNLGIPSKSKHQEQALDALKIMLSPEYQGMIAENGMLPGLTTANDKLPADQATQEGAKAAKDAKLTPASPKWSDVESKKYLQDAFTKLAQGGDVTEIAKALDEQIESTLNG